QIANYKLPPALAALDWFSSPLLRARETAQLLGVNAASEQALIEMNWGDWEGQTLSDLRARDPQGFAAAEAQGFDLLPPQGESPRMVAHRVTEWAQMLVSSSTYQALGCVAHKGVIRAIYAQAANWPMLDKPPHALDFHCAQHFIYRDGQWSIGQLNIAL
ncbi:MAG: histidine phosphatase family protein, partial [Pseudomonadales bacterium]